jgi:hypothetical protein
MAAQEFSFVCSICGTSVDITTCATDEFGKAVHSVCYTAKLAREKMLPPRPTSKQLRPPKVA